MILIKLLRNSHVLRHPNARGYFSSRINSLFITNYEKYAEKLKSEEVTQESKRLTHLLGEYSQLLGSIKDVEKELSNKSSDSEMLSLMKEEKAELEVQQNELMTKVLNEIHSYELSKDAERIPESSSILFEVSAGVGGKEAMLFGNELANFYVNYMNHKRWDIQDIEHDEQGGSLRHFRAKVEGCDVWEYMRFEAGVHRVQRVPETEARGRVHTSTVSIACIPINENFKVDIDGEWL